MVPFFHSKLFLIKYIGELISISSLAYCVLLNDGRVNYIKVTESLYIIIFNIR